MKTEDFSRGQRVRVVTLGVCHNMIGTVIGHDAYTVDVRFDEVTEEMRHYEDTVTGVGSFLPQDLEQVKNQHETT